MVTCLHTGDSPVFSPVVVNFMCQCAWARVPRNLGRHHSGCFYADVYPSLMCFAILETRAKAAQFQPAPRKNEF